MTDKITSAEIMAAIKGWWCCATRESDYSRMNRALIAGAKAREEVQYECVDCSYAGPEREFEHAIPEFTEKHLCPKCESTSVIIADSPAQASPPDGFVLAPIDLIGAACSAIDKKRDAPEILAKLREIIFAHPVSAVGEDSLQEFKRRRDIRLNDYLCEMKPGFDDAICGFNEASEVVNKLLAEMLAPPTGESK
jgi:hypothetical protein